jgi:hypothetical protein
MIFAFIENWKKNLKLLSRWHRRVLALNNEVITDDGWTLRLRTLRGASMTRSALTTSKDDGDHAVVMWTVADYNADRLDSLAKP